MSNSSIKISVKNNKYYSNLIDTMLFLRKFTSKIYNMSITNEEMVNQVCEIINDNIDKQLNFNQFVADILDEEEIIEIDFKLYEKYIRIKHCFEEFKIIKSDSQMSFNAKIWTFEVIIASFIKFNNA